MGRLKAEADRLLDRSIAPNSHRAYDSAWQAYVVFCNDICSEPTLPISRQQLMLFIAHLSISGKQASTISSYISGLAYIHKSKNFVDPTDCFVVRKLIEGCRRDNPPVQDIRRPLTLDMLSHAIAGTTTVCSSLYEACLFRAAMLVAFYGLLRVGEFTISSANQKADHVLLLSDISFSPQQGGQLDQVYIKIRYSKTDQRGRSHTLVLPETTPTAMCPVHALREYLAMRTPGVGQLFWHFNKSPLTRYQFTAVVKKSLNARNIPTEGISSHSFRIGACTHFALLGVPDENLMKMGRWSSSAYQRYIRIPMSTL